MNLNEAINAVESAAVSLGNADAAQAAAQAKYDAALAGKTSADQADVDSVTAFNGALDTLIQAATSAKVDRSKVAAPPAPSPAPPTE